MFATIGLNFLNFDFNFNFSSDWTRDSCFFGDSAANIWLCLAYFFCTVATQKMDCNDWNNINRKGRTDNWSIEHKNHSVSRSIHNGKQGFKHNFIWMMGGFWGGGWYVYEKISFKFNGNVCFPVMGKYTIFWNFFFDNQNCLIIDRINWWNSLQKTTCMKWRICFWWTKNWSKLITKDSMCSMEVMVSKCNKIALCALRHFDKMEMIGGNCYKKKENKMTTAVNDNGY